MVAPLVTLPCIEDRMPWLDWYNSLSKPSWTPAPATIGLIWQILYPVIVVSFGTVFVARLRLKVPWPVAQIDINHPVGVYVPTISNSPAFT
jgi:tryptophan-rich sensory protein